MLKKTLIPLALILMFVLAACGGQQTADPATAVTAADDNMDDMAEDHDGDMDEAHDGDMDEEHDGDMDEAHDDDMDEAHDDDMDEAHDEDMDEAHDEDMDEAHDEDMDEEHDGEVEMEMEGEDDSMESSSAAMMELPVWQTLAVANAATGESFSFGDFNGKTVFVEPMATWCGNCRAQQGHVREAKTQLGDDVVFVGLSLETTLPAEDLARYSQDNGFDWTYAVMSQELLAGLADEFGRSITSAPSTPHFIIRPDGSFSELSTGIHSAEEIIAQIQEAQSY